MVSISRKISLLFIVIFGIYLIVGTSGISARTVTDQLGRQVEIPEKVERVVVLEHHALDVIIQIGAQSQVVGIMERWKKILPGAAKSMPELEGMATPGDLTVINVEELLKTNPDLVIFTHYAPAEMVKQIESAGIPAIAVSFYRADYEQASRLNPELKNPDKAYTEGMKDGITLLGDVFGHPDRAAKLLEYIVRNREMIKNRLGDIAREDRIRCYMANPELHTYGTGKYTGVIMERAGGRNVAEEIKGYQQVSMEEVLKWNPEVIFVQDRYQDIIPQMKNDPAWQATDAVKNDRLYLCPEYVKPWGHPCPESFALGEMWMATKLYPEKFKDVDLAKLVDDYYRTFYGLPYDGGH